MVVKSFDYTVANNIRALRLQKGMSQAELAELVGVSRLDDLVFGRYW